MKRPARTSYWDVRVGEQLLVGPNIRLRVEQKSGQLARIRLDCAEETEVRKETPAAASFARRGI